MKAKSNDSPVKIAVERYDGVADVVLCENIELADEDGVGVYTYDTYRITVPERSGLEDMIFLNFDAWVECAKNAELAKPVPTIEERVLTTETKVVTIEETIDVLFGGLS